MEDHFIIAEAGINHNGDIKIAKKLADAAKACDADSVKYQTFENIKFLKKYELTDEEFIDLKDYCDDIGIVFLSTPHTFRSIHFLNELVPMYKVAHPFMFVGKFLIEVDSYGKPIILSTGNQMSSNGMASLDEIGNALKFIKKSKVILMHCISKYPCGNPHYERINELKNSFKLEVGLSDHSKNIKIPKMKYIERHLMLPNIKSIDSNVSLNPKQFKQMVKYVKG